MKKTFILLFSFILILTTVVSCKKDEQPQPNKTITNTDLLTAKPWKYASIIVNPPKIDNIGDTIHEIIGLNPACHMDNIESYFANGDLEIDEGPTKCDSSKSQKTITIWKFTDNETKLEVFGFKSNIKKLTIDTFTTSFINIHDDSRLYTVTFIH